ncbi:MAG: hypothetical protein D6718_05270 [Acidobacteria bacterium]|nr:MAG: hypothetical protein D6718_05270 [Acidobacteriota bacterium]
MRAHTSRMSAIGRACERFGRCAAAALVLAAASPAAGQGEVWTVNEASQDLAIIDMASDTLSGHVLLPTDCPGGTPCPPARGIAFSTLPGAVGAFAFTAQGSLLRIVDAGLREVIDTVDLEREVGYPLTVEAIASARPQWFDAAPGPSPAPQVRRTYLHLAADVETAPGAATEPWYVILDQEVLLAPYLPPSAAPSAGDLLVAAGPLLDFPPSPPAPYAAGVTVLPGGEGWARQRAWYAVGIPAGPGGETPNRMRAVLIAKRSRETDPWEVVRYRETTLGPAQALPQLFRPGAPFDRQLPVFPEGPLGQLTNLDTGGVCFTGGTLVDVAVSGPGPSSTDVLAVNRTGGPNDELLRIDPITCLVQSERTGEGSIAVAVTGTNVWDRAYVANHDSSTVTIVHADASVPPDTTPINRIGVRSSGPVGIAVRPSDGAICRAVNLTAERRGSDVLLSWEHSGDECLNVVFRVCCACLEGHPDCPCAEGNGPPCEAVGHDAPSAAFPTDRSLAGPGNPDGQNGWIRLGFTGPGGTSFTHTDGAIGFGQLYDVGPDDGN